MAITRTAMVDDDGTGTTGTIINNAWKTELYNQIDGAIVPLGAWTDVPFNAANYVADAGAWTVAAGNVGTHAYTVINKTLLVFLHITGSALTAPTSVIRVQHPAGLTIANRPNLGNGAMSWANAGATGTGLSLHSTSQLALVRDISVSAPWAAGATSISGIFFVPLA